MNQCATLTRSVRGNPLKLQKGSCTDTMSW